MSEELKHKLFSATECINEQTLFDYIDNKLTAKERHLVEKHLLDCDLCADALEGLEMVKDRSRITAINNEINKKIALEIEKKPKVISINYKLYSAIAASILLLIGAVFFFNQFSKKEMLEDKIAEVKKPETTTPSEEKPVEMNALENKKDNAKDADKNTEAEKTEQQQLKTVSKEKTADDNRNANGKGEAVTSVTTISNGLAVTKTLEDGDNQQVNIPAQPKTEQTNAVLQEVVTADETAKKPAATTDVAGYTQTKNAELLKQNDNAERKREMKKKETTREEENKRFSMLAEGKKDKAAKEPDEKAVTGGAIAAAPQKSTAYKNEDFESTIEGNTKIAADSISAAVDEEPVFPGGADSLQNFIHINFHYNSNYYTWDAQLGTKITVAFTVDSKGKVKNPKIIKGINEELNKEAIRVVNSMPDWKPAMNKGKAVSKLITIPIQLEIH